MDIKSQCRQLSPVAIEVESGKTYTWCGCGNSLSFPFCDDSGECSLSMEFVATLTETIHFCGCGQTKNPPLCDGTHGKIWMELLKKREVP